MNSIMSLQNITLFYWGQNRLLSVVPFLIYPLKDPVLNVYGYLILSAVIFYAMVMACSQFIRRTFINTQSNVNLYEVFICTVFLLLFFLKEDALFNMMIGHIEYSLPFLGLFIVYFLLFSSVYSSKMKYTIAAVVLFIAIGINFSIVIPAVILSASHAFLEKKISRAHIFLFFISCLSFVIWYWISKQYFSHLQYTHLIWNNVNSHVLKSLTSILGSLHVFNALLGLLFLLLLSLLRNNSLTQKQNTVLLLILSFCLFWLLFFSLNEWLHINGYHFRYFIPILFLLVAVCAYFTIVQLITIQKRIRILFSVLIIVFILGFLWSQPKSLLEYDVIKRAKIISEKVTSSETRFYAGDYWYVWPVVILDMMNGYNSFGLAFRGDANKDSVVDAIAQQMSKHGEIDVICVYSDVSECVKQFGQFDAYSQISNNLKIDNNITVLRYVKPVN